MFITLLTLIFVRPFVSSLAYPFANFIFTLILLLLAVVWIIRRDLYLKESKLVLPVALLFIALFVSMALHYNGPRELYKYTTGILVFIICGSLSYREQNRLISVLSAAGIFISCLAIYQYFFGFPFLNSYIAREKITDPFILEYIGQRRVFFPFVTPNTLAGYLAMVIPLTLTYKNRLWLALPLFFALLLTRSIGALLSLCLALTLYLYLQGKVKKRDLIVYAALLFSVLLVFVVRTQVRKEHLQPLFSTLMRLNYWKDTWAIIKAHPFSGVGLGNFNLVFSRYSHNSYLQIWAELGALGIISFLWIAAFTLKSGWNNLNDPARKIKTCALLSAACVFLLHNLVDFSFFLPEVNLIWWAIAGLLTNRYPGKEGPDYSRPQA